MRLETFPVLLGVLFALAALALIADAVTTDGTLVKVERRSRERPQRHRLGELALGVGLMFVAAALIGGDRWRYTTLAVLGALLAFGTGLALNFKYVRGLMFGPVAGHRKRRATDVVSSDEPPDSFPMR